MAAGGELDEAADAYRRVVVADPKNIAAWLGLGSARLKALVFAAPKNPLYQQGVQMLSLRLAPPESLPEPKTPLPRLIEISWDN